MVVAQEGETAAFCTGWLEDHHWTGETEPVFRGTGLAGVLMSTILASLKDFSATKGYINDPSEPLVGKDGFGWTRCFGRLGEIIWSF